MLKPAWPRIPAHSVHLSSSTASTQVSALTQQHKQPSVTRLPNWGQLLGELEVGGVQTSFLRKKSVILTFPEVRQSCSTPASCSHSTYSLPRTSSGIESSMNQIWFKSKITGHQQGFSYTVTREGSRMFWVRGQFSSFPTGFTASPRHARS